MTYFHHSDPWRDKLIVKSENSFNFHDILSYILASGECERVRNWREK